MNNTLLVNATHDASLLAGDERAVVTVTAGHDANLTATAGNVTSTLLVQAGTDAKPTAGTNITSNVVTATSGNATLLAGTTITADKVTAGLVASLTATAGTSTPRRLSKPAPMPPCWPGHTINSVTVNAGGNAKLTANPGM